MKQAFINLIVVLSAMTIAACSSSGPFPPEADDYVQSYAAEGDHAIRFIVDFDFRIERNFSDHTTQYDVTEARFFARFETRPFPLPAYFNTECELIDEDENDAECTFIGNLEEMKNVFCTSAASLEYHLEGDVSYTRTTNGSSTTGETEYESPTLNLRDASPADGGQDICDMPEPEEEPADDDEEAVEESTPDAGASSGDDIDDDTEVSDDDEEDEGSDDDEVVLDGERTLFLDDDPSRLSDNDDVCAGDECLNGGGGCSFMAQTKTGILNLLFPTLSLLPLWLQKRKHR